MTFSLALKTAVVALLAMIALGISLLAWGQARGFSYSAGSQSVEMSAWGNALVGAPSDMDSADFRLSNATVVVSAVDHPGSPENQEDRVFIDAVINDGDRTYSIKVRQIMQEDPLGRFDTSGGVGVDGSLLPGGNNLVAGPVDARLIAFGYGDVVCHGEQVGLGVPVRLVALKAPAAASSRLMLDIGDSRLGRVTDLEKSNGEMRVYGRITRKASCCRSMRTVDWSVRRYVVVSAPAARDTGNAAPEEQLLYQPAFNQQFRYLQRVGRRALAHVIRDYPQVQRALCRIVLADAAHEDLVAPGGVDRHRVFLRVRIV